MDNITFGANSLTENVIAQKTKKKNCNTNISIK